MPSGNTELLMKTDEIDPGPTSQTNHTWKNITMSGRITFGNLKSLTLLNVRFTGNVVFNNARIPSVVIQNCSFVNHVEGVVVCDSISIRGPMSILYHVGQDIHIAGRLVSDMCSTQAD